MIQLQINYRSMEMELRGSDEIIIDELSTATIRILSAMERYGGNPAADNLTALILNLLEKHEQNQNGTA